MNALRAHTDECGFEHFGTEVRCVRCEVGGYWTEWPQWKCREHFEERHRREALAAKRVRKSSEPKPESVARRERRHRSKGWEAFHAPRKCKGCPDDFTPARAGQVYCGPECGEQDRYVRRWHGDDAAEPKVRLWLVRRDESGAALCDECGARLPERQGRRGAPPKRCSAECRKAAKARQKRAGGKRR